MMPDHAFVFTIETVMTIGTPPHVVLERRDAGP